MPLWGHALSIRHTSQGLAALAASAWGESPLQEIAQIRVTIAQLRGLLMKVPARSRPSMTESISVNVEPDRNRNECGSKCWGKGAKTLCCKENP